MALLSDVIRSGIRAEDLTDLPPELRKGLEPLLRFVNTGIQGLASAFGQNITIGDNLRVEVQTIPMDHGVPVLISLKKLPTAKGVMALSVGSKDGKAQTMLDRPLHLTGTTVPNHVKVTAFFTDTTQTRVPVTLMLCPDGTYSSITPT